jgi:hypothetical protein
MFYWRIAGEDFGQLLSASKAAGLPLNATGIDMSRVITVVACGLALAGCAAGSDFLPKYEPSPVTIQFESEPAGAEAKTTAGQSCRTPCALSMAPDKDFSVTFALAGYESQTVPVQKGRPEGLAESEASPSLLPNPVYVELDPAKPAAKRAPAPARKPAPAAASTPRPAAAAGPASPWPGQ